MKKKSFVVESARGLHARPAAAFVDLLSNFESEIIIIFDDMEMNAKSIISVLSLGLGQGDCFEIVVKGPDEQEAIIAIEQFLHEKTSGEKGKLNDIIGQNFKESNC